MHKLLRTSFLAALCATSPLAAQQPAPAPSNPPVAPAAKAAPKAAPTQPGDPFVREPRAPKAPTPPVSDAAIAPVNLLTTIETWAVGQDDFVAFLNGPAGEREPYDHLEELAKAGKAKLVGLIAVNTRSGQRAVVESADEVRYATEFSPAGRSGEIAFPRDFETREAGDYLEIEPILGPDGKTIEDNLVTHTVRFEGFRDWQPEATAAPIGQPQFRQEKVTTTMTVYSGHANFLTTATPAQTTDDNGSGQIRFRIVRTSAQPVQPVQPVQPAPPPEVLPAQARVEFFLYTMDRDTARGVLNHASSSAESYAAVAALVAKGEAQLETVNAFVTRPGTRGVNQEAAEFRYPTTPVPPSFESQTSPAENRQPASFGAFETRTTGVSVEIDAIFSPDARFTDINVVPKVVRMIGMLKANGVAEKYPAQPVFNVRQVTTSASSAVGVPVLVGTMSQPADSGVNDRKDDGRTSLAYIRVTAVSP